MLRLMHTHFIAIILVLSSTIGFITSTSAQQLAQTPEIDFTANAGPHAELEIPAPPEETRDWHTVPYDKCKPIITRVLLRLYRVRIINGYVKEGDPIFQQKVQGKDLQVIDRLALVYADVPSIIRRAHKLNEINGQEVVPTNENMRKYIDRRLWETMGPDIGNYLEEEKDFAPAAFLRQDTLANYLYTQSIAAKAPDTLDLKFAESVPPNVRLVDPITHKVVPGFITQELMRRYGIWNFSVWNVRRNNYRTRMAEVYIEWEFEVSVDPISNAPNKTAPFLDATFEGVPPLAQQQNDSPGSQPEDKQQDDNKKQAQQNIDSTPQAKDSQEPTNFAGLLGLSLPQLIALGRQPGLDLITGLAIPNNGPTGIIGLTAFMDKHRNSCDMETSGDWSSRIGLLVGHTLGNRAGWVVGPSIKFGSSTWLYAGGHFADANGSTRPSFAFGVAYRISDVLGGTGNNNNAQMPTPTEVTVKAETAKNAEIGPDSTFLTHTDVVAEFIPNQPHCFTTIRFWFDDGSSTGFQTTSSVDTHVLRSGTVVRIEARQGYNGPVVDYISAEHESTKFRVNDATKLPAEGIILSPGKRVILKIEEDSAPVNITITPNPPTVFDRVRLSYKEACQIEFNASEIPGSLPPGTVTQIDILKSGKVIDSMTANTSSQRFKVNGSNKLPAIVFTPGQNLNLKIEEIQGKPQPVASKSHPDDGSTGLSSANLEASNTQTEQTTALLAASPSNDLSLTSPVKHVLNRKAKRHFSLLSTSTTVLVKGVLAPPTGTTPSQAHVEILTADGSQTVAFVSIGNNGRFYARLPKPGIYKLRASMPGHKTFEKVISVKSGADPIAILWD